MASWQGRYPAVPETAKEIRCEIAAIARDCGLSELAVADVKLAVSEAATNAIQHAYRHRHAGDLTATTLSSNGVLWVVISDDGDGVHPRTDSPGLGLGLPLIASTTQGFEIVNKPTGGTEIHMRFPCPAAQAA